jgi:hypothetical protein
MQDNVKKSILRLEKAKRVAGRIIDAPLIHLCSREFCYPENENDLINQGLLQPPAICPDVYLCNYRCHHICTAESCGNSVLGVCPISGACYGPQDGYSNFSRADYRTWHADFRKNEREIQTDRKPNPSLFFDNVAPIEIVEPTKKKKKKTPKKNFVRKKIAAEIFTKLVYSPIRKKVNKRREDELQNVLDKEIASYIRTCEKNREVPCIPYIMMLQDTYREDYDLLETLDYNDEIVNKYTAMLNKAFGIVDKYFEDPVKPEIIIMGVLYLARQEYRVGETVLIEHDPFLLAMLPQGNNLPAFGTSKRHITKGKQVLKRALSKGLDSGASLDSLVLKV